MTADPVLPAELGALCERVARLTRLRRAERADVERELRSHFREALAAGRSPDDAAAAFGDPKTAARDLRAAAIAKRSPIDRTLTQTLKFTGLAAAAVTLAYGGFAAYLHLKAPVISFDPLERIHASLAAPATPDDAAWPVYRRAFLALGLGIGDAEDRSAGAEAARNAPLPGSEEWPAATAWLDAHADALATLRDAARRPVLGLPLGREFDAADAPLFGDAAVQASRDAIATRNDPREFPTLSLLLPHLSRARAASKLLALDAMHAGETGDGERFVSDVEAGLRLSFHMQDGRFLIGDLVGIAIRSLVAQRAMATLEWKPDLLDAAQLARLQRSFESLPADLRRMNLSCERMMFEDILQRLYTDDGAGNGTFRLDRDALLPLIGMVESMSGTGAASPRTDDPRRTDPVFVATLLSGPVAAFTVADRRDTMAFVDRWCARFEESSTLPLRDLSKFHALSSEFEAEAGGRASVRFLLPKSLMPAVAKASLACARDRATLAAAAAACAAMRWRLDHAGAWPTRVEDLVPGYLAAVPEDPWSGTPVRMAGEGAAFRIWSVGEDGIDDAGDPDADDLNVSDLGASTLAFRGSITADGTPAYLGDRPKVDWVWFAPRGNLERWKPRNPRRGDAVSG